MSFRVHCRERPRAEGGNLVIPASQVILVAEEQQHVVVRCAFCNRAAYLDDVMETWSPSYVDRSGEEQSRPVCVACQGVCVRLQGDEWVEV